MGKLETAVNRFVDPDSAYRLIVEAHRGLSAHDSAALNARLVLVLANQIGDLDVLGEALALAKAAQPATSAAPP